MPEETKPQCAHTLFIRPDCKYSSMALAELERANVRTEFTVIDVTQTPTPQVRNVPSVLADHQRMMEGREAIAWLLNYIKESPQCAPNSCGFESMSNMFTFIDPSEDNTHLTNSALSTVYTAVDPDFKIDDSMASPPVVEGDDSMQRPDPLADAMSKMQHERDNSFQVVHRS